MRVTKRQLAALQEALDKLNVCFDAISELEKAMGMPPGGVEIDTLSELSFAKADAEGIRFLRQKSDEWMESVRRANA